MMRRFVSVLGAVLFLLCGMRSNTAAAETMIRVAFDPALPPYQFVRDGQCMGAHLEILDSIAKMTGLVLEYYPMENATACVRALENGEVDLVLGAVGGGYYDGCGMYTQSISQSSICMVVRNDNLSKVQGNKTGITAVYQNSTIGLSFIRNINNLRTIPVADQQRAFGMLVEGDVDAFVAVRSAVLYQLEQENLSDNYTIVSNYMLPVEHAMLVRDGDHELLGKLNNAIYQLRITGEFETIHDKWAAKEEWYATNVLMQRIAFGISCVLAVVVAGFLFNLRLNVMLKRQVSQKTMELQQSNLDLQHQIRETQHSNELRNRIVDNSPKTFLAFDTSFQVEFFNPTAKEMLGRKLRRGCNIFDLPLVRGMLAHQRDAVFHSPIENGEYLHRDDYGRELHYRYRLYLLYNNEKGRQSIRGAILEIADATKEIVLKEQINERQKNQFLNRVVASIAHEIRNPLMSIKTYAELIPVKQNNKEFQSQLAQYVPMEVDRVNDLITNLIDYAKPRTSNREQAPLEELLESCSMLVLPMLSGKNIQLELDLEPGLVITADRGQIKQAVINILLNAMDAVEAKAARTDRVITVRTHSNRWYIYLEVTDQGLGMSEEQIAHAVEPFFTTKDSGTGLGLALCKQFVEDNGGRLLIASEKHRGTTVTLRFER